MSAPLTPGEYSRRMCQRLILLLALPFLLFIAPASADTGQNRITHGPILGRPGPSTMGVWARTFQPGAFRVLYGTAREKLDQQSGPVKTTLERDNTAWVVLKNLTPDTVYHYAVVTDGKTVRPEHNGRFKTLPDPEKYRSPVRNPAGLFNFAFEIGCGNLIHERRSADPRMGIFDVALDRLGGTLDFAIQTGDFIYEDNPARMLTPEQWAKRMNLPMDAIPGLLKVAPRIVGVWENYKRYFDQSPALARWYRHVPGFFMLDDHEIMNDVKGTGEAGYRSRAACFRDIGVRAWQDYVGWANPVGFTQDIHFGVARFQKGSDLISDPTADFPKLDLDQAASLIVHWGRADDGVLNPRLDMDPQPANPNAGVYHIESVVDQQSLRITPPARYNGTDAYAIGRRNYFNFTMANVEFFFLDTRNHRGLPLADFERRTGQSMLGPRQKSWLKNAMQQSTADFLLVISSVNFMIPHVGKGGFVPANGHGDESWTGFMAEREELIAFWEQLGKPVLIFSGDLHNSFAVKITDRIWEFAAGPHNSANHNLSSEGGRPVNGPYLSGGRPCQIRWSTFFLDDTAAAMRKQPVFTVAQVNNVFNNPGGNGAPSWVAYPHPQITVQFFNGMTGDLLYAESVAAGL